MAEDTRPPMAPIDPTVAATVRSAYLHVPFCSHKCGYCDFASVAGKDDQMTAYVAALDAEIAGHLSSPAEVDTIFVGGGTPTYLTAPILERLMAVIRSRFRLATGGEFTVESNPNTLSADKVSILADAGVNRVSLGAQSFHPRLLTVLERDHDPTSVGRAIDLVRKRIENFSLDLIFGVPGQTLAEWQSDLEALLDLQTSHCSTYGLTYEKGTPLWRQRKLGVVHPVDEELERAMFEHALDRLADAGWTHYEVSNFARPGKECRHNLAYWANDACFGFGVGAAGYVAGTRRMNIRDLDAYIRRATVRQSVAAQSESLDPEERARETAMLNLRRSSGLDRREFERRTGFRIDDLVGPSLQKFVRTQLLLDDGSNVRLSRAGLFVADGVFRELL